MSTGTRPVDALVGVYNADGGIVGELRYVTSKVFGRAHCALCDITHRGLTPRREWSQACERIAVPFELLHLNERPDAVRRASEGAVPCVLAKAGDELVMLLGPADLEACAKDVDEFERRLRSAGAHLGFTFPILETPASREERRTMTDGPISSGSGTPDDPWQLKTPPLKSEYTMHRDTRDGVDVIVCTVGKTVLLYDARCLDDLHAMLEDHGDWMELGSADEQKPAKPGTVEAWARASDNPIGGWYGLKKGYRGRFGMYVPPLMEHLGRAEVEHNARGNRMRAR